MAITEGAEVKRGRPASEAVTLAYVHSEDVAYSWVHSLLQLTVADLVEHRRVGTGGFIAMSCNAGQLVESRNRVAEQFLGEDKADWLLWLDTDMGFLPDLVERLMEVADPETRPIVGALCFSHRQVAPDDFGGRTTMATPTIFDWVERNGLEGFDIRYDYPQASLVRCDGTGSAAVLIHRRVFEGILAEYGPHWYDPIQAKEGRVGEDLSFCIRAGAIGVPIYVHTGIRTTHQKHLWLSEAHYLEQSVAPPAAEPVAVLVPVLERPEHAEPFMRSLRASTGLATAYAVVESDDADTELAWKEAGAEVLYCPATPGRPGTFAEKINVGFNGTREPWIFICGSDVEFHSGWYNAAVDRAGDRFHVIGTNDLGNPRVMAGEHATHLLIRRSYVDEVGASWDGPGVVCCEEYRHWYVDDEIVTAARQRGVWAMELGSVVEHLHPLWGKGAPDAVYTLGQASMEKDQAVYRRRLAEHAS